MSTKAPLQIQHFSDILCVWAYASEVRMDELATNFCADLDFAFHYLPVFGHVRAKLTTQWADRGGIDAYAQHVAEVAGQFEHIRLHADTWTRVVPESSLPAHLVLSAVRILDRKNGTAALREYARQLRQAFFTEARDIAQRGELLAVAEATGINVAAIETLCESGRATYELVARGPGGETSSGPQTVGAAP